MSTLSKSDAARINGAQSHGPITPEGKAKSAANSLRHGLTAKAIVLPSESQEAYDALLAAYTARFQPADQVELDLVESMAVSRWRLRRIANIETNLLAEEIAVRATRDESKDDDQLLASAFRSEAATLATLTRYENSLNRAFDRALKQLQLLQRARLPMPVPSPVGSFRPLAPPPVDHQSPTTPQPESLRLGVFASDISVLK